MNRGLSAGDFYACSQLLVQFLMKFEFSII